MLPYLLLCGSFVATAFTVETGNLGCRAGSSAWKGWKGALLRLAKPQPSSDVPHLHTSCWSCAALKESECQKQKKRKEAISKLTHVGVWGFCVSSRVANESCHEETLDKMPIALISKANFPSGSLILYSFLHGGPTTAGGMQRIAQDCGRVSSWQLWVQTTSKRG